MLQEGKYKQASVQYKRTVSWLEHESGLSEEDEKKAKALRLAAHLNLAMCFLKLHEPNQALENCNKVQFKVDTFYKYTIGSPNGRANTEMSVMWIECFTLILKPASGTDDVVLQMSII